VTTKTFGKRTRRLEDPELLRGKARFVDDIHIDGTRHAAFVRSPHAHAKIIAIDKTNALAMPGVHAVLTREDIRARTLTDRLAVALPDRVYKQQRDRPILADDETVYVGEAIAMVIADNPYVAEDALSRVDIAFDVLPAVSDCRNALAPGAPKVHSDASDNLIAEFTSGYG
jgi:carbon-monoxide dehydrogenase large subunit